MAPRQSLRALICVLCILLQSALLAQDFAESDYQLLDEPVAGEVDVRAEVRLGGDGWPQGAVARIAFNYQDDGNLLYLQMAANGLMLGEARGRVHEVLATSPTWPSPAEAGVHRIVIKRRSWAIRVLCNGRTVLSAYDQFAPGERIGSAARGVEIADVHTQPIGEMVFEDDFARPAGEPDPWEVMAGDWRIRLPESRNKAAEAGKSANPFSYRATGGDALAVAGSSFWDGYEARVAVKPSAAGAVGLAFYVQGSRDHYVFRVSATEKQSYGGGKAELVKVAEGRETILAERAQSVTIGEWHELAVRAHDGRLEGLIDGDVLCAARDETFGEGGIGLYTRECAKAYFDDVALEPYRFFHDDYRPGGKMPIAQRAGSWTLYQNRLCGRPGAASHVAIGLTGCHQWRDYAFAVDVLPWTATGVGIYFGCTGPEDYYLFRWGPDASDTGRQVQELWKVEGGQGTRLDRRIARLHAEATHRVEVTLDRAYIGVTVDGEPILDAVDGSRSSAGQVGYYAEGTAQAVAAFDNMRVRFMDPPTAPVSVAAQFAREDLMANWARPAASWKSAGERRLYAYALPVWGDFDIRVGLRRFVQRKGSIAVRLADTREALREAPPCLEIVSEKGDTELRCLVPEGDSKKELGRVQVEAERPLLEIERRGRCITASIDGTVFAWTRAPDGDDAPIVGLKLEGTGLPLNDVTLTSPNIIDTSFGGAPTDWRPNSGVWEIGDRWNCQPQWSWLCGSKAETPLLWSKRAFPGDIVFEFWSGMMMDLRKGPGYKHPSDMNGIICGDGVHLCSGYAFVYAGDKNTRSKLLRAGEVIGENRGVKFPHPPTSGNRNFHNSWFHCRMEKTGSRLTYLVNNKKVVEYEDPSPLSGGHVGLWTHQNNGILIARVRIAFKD